MNATERLKDSEGFWKADRLWKSQNAYNHINELDFLASRVIVNSHGPYSMTHLPTKVPQNIELLSNNSIQCDGARQQTTGKINHIGSHLEMLHINCSTSDVIESLAPLTVKASSVVITSFCSKDAVSYENLAAFRETFDQLKRDYFFYLGDSEGENSEYDYEDSEDDEDEEIDDGVINGNRRAPQNVLFVTQEKASWGSGGYAKGPMVPADFSLHIKDMDFNRNGRATFESCHIIENIRVLDEVEQDTKVEHDRERWHAADADTFTFLTVPQNMFSQQELLKRPILRNIHLGSTEWLRLKCHVLFPQIIDSSISEIKKLCLEGQEMEEYDFLNGVDSDSEIVPLLSGTEELQVIGAMLKLVEIAPPSCFESLTFFEVTAPTPTALCRKIKFPNLIKLKLQDTSANFPAWDAPHLKELELSVYPGVPLLSLDYYSLMYPTVISFTLQCLIQETGIDNFNKLVSYLCFPLLEELEINDGSRVLPSLSDQTSAPEPEVITLEPELPELHTIGLFTDREHTSWRLDGLPKLAKVRTRRVNWIQFIDCPEIKSFIAHRSTDMAEVYSSLPVQEKMEEMMYATIDGKPIHNFKTPLGSKVQVNPPSSLKRY